MATKMSPKFVVLSALAVGAIYATGYSVSAAGSTALAASSSSASNASNAASQASGSSSGRSSSKSGGQTSNTSAHSSRSSSASSSSNAAQGKSSGTSSSPSKAANTTQQYLDGTYSGSAANQIGAVSVSVTVHGGKIANVQITSCYTHYPESYIDPVLPDYVVAHQTTQIPVVSGATLSTEDFYYAVVQALQQAQNPNYKG